MKPLRFAVLSALALLLGASPLNLHASFNGSFNDLDGPLRAIVTIIWTVALVFFLAWVVVTLVAPFVLVFLRFRFLRGPTYSISRSRWLRVGCLAAGTPALCFATYLLRVESFDPVVFSRPEFVLLCVLVAIAALGALVPDAWLTRLSRKNRS